MGRSERRLERLLQRSSEIVAVVDGDLRVTYVSPSVEAALYVSATAMEKGPFTGIVHPDDRREFEAFFADLKARPGHSASMRVRLWGNGGLAPYADVVCTNLLADPDVGGVVLNIRDVSARRLLEDQLSYQAFNDSLTDLASRLRFMDRLEHALISGKREGKHSAFSVLYVDLDHFRNVNHTLGHAAGDEVLRVVAQRIAVCARPVDTAARLGGDEFALLLEGTDSLEGARLVAYRLLNEMSYPFQVGSSELHLSASIGIVMVDPLTMSAEDVVRAAELAMYEAKSSGRGSAAVHAPEAKDSLNERTRLVDELSDAIVRCELAVYYQPAFDLKTDALTGFEALVRWQHPRRGLLDADEFMPVAEDTGAVLAIGEMALMEACNQARSWQPASGARPGVSVSVAVSARQVQRPGLLDLVRRALAKSGLAPHLLVLEVPERVLAEQTRRAIDTLQKIRALGVRVAISGFGAGSSAIGSVKTLPVDIVKLDRCLTDDIDSNDHDRIFVHSLVSLGHALGLETVATGIERRGQLAHLQAIGCTSAQGHLFARPMDAVTATRLLEQRAPDGVYGLPD